MNHSVTVLLENGRRQRVPVKLSTPILVILDEVCKKHQLKTEDYDLKFHNRILDTGSTIQFCNIPNNVLLELVPASKSRSESPVTIFLQLETGERLSGSFLPSNTLWEVIDKLCDELIKSKSNPVIIYTRQEVLENSLKTTSLKRLGLTGGNALLRLLHRSEDQLKNQSSASVYKLPLKSKIEQPGRMRPKEGSLKDFKKEQSIVERNQERANTTNTFSASLSSTSNMIETSDSNVNQLRNETPKFNESTSENPPLPNCSKKIINEHTVTSKLPTTKPSVADINSFNINDIKFMGERYALIFPIDQISSPKFDDAPDDFFELTVEDAKTLLRDVRRTRSELEGFQLETSELKARKKSSMFERTVSIYPHCVVRVLFPNRYALQGVFKSNETVAEVVAFVKSFLEISSVKFHLYVVPPKSIVPLDKTLIDVGGVPGINFHFGGEYVDEQPNGSFFHQRFLEEPTQVDVALKVANYFRRRASGQATSQASDVDVCPLTPQLEEDRTDLHPSLHQPNLMADPPKKKSDRPVPKWFKHQ